MPLRPIAQVKSPVNEDDFKCPYVNLPLRRACEVSSCNYNLSNNEASVVFKRCFLYFTDQVRKKPGAAKNEHDFNAFPQDKRNKIASQFFDVPLQEVDRINSEFYMSLFSVFAEDISISLRKQQLDPVPFRQCAVCGSEEDKLYCPRGVLPSGYGYCSYACFQLKPPPILMIEKNMDLDFGEFLQKMEHESYISRSKFIRQLIELVFASLPTRL